MKTLFLYIQQYDMTWFFFEKEGDYQHLNNYETCDKNKINELLQNAEKLDKPTKVYNYFVVFKCIL